MLEIKIDIAKGEKDGMFKVGGSVDNIMAELSAVVGSIYGDIVMNAVNDLSEHMPKAKIIELIREDFTRRMAMGMAMVEYQVRAKIFGTELKDADNTPESSENMVLSEFMKNLMGEGANEPYKARIKTQLQVSKENPDTYVFTLKEFIGKLTDGNITSEDGHGTFHDGENDTGIEVFQDGEFVKTKGKGYQYVLWHFNEKEV